MQYNITDIPLIVNENSPPERVRQLVQDFAFRTQPQPPEHSFYLQLYNGNLTLRQSDQIKQKPILVDFLNGNLAHRQRFGGGRGQAIAKAVGLKSGFNPSVWDATAGLAKDAFVLASLGATVTLCERSKILAALIDDALRRAAQDPETGSWVAQRMHLLCGDSSDRLAQLPESQRPDVVYIDPMYPDRKKNSALVKKEMQALQKLLGPDEDSQTLLQTALQTALRRVVVKRPSHAAPLHDTKPTVSIESRKTRYDVYVTL